MMVTVSALPLSPLMGLFSLDGLDVDDWCGRWLFTWRGCCLLLKINCGSAKLTVGRRGAGTLTSKPEGLPVINWCLEHFLRPICLGVHLGASCGRSRRSRQLPMGRTIPDASRTIGTWQKPQVETSSKPRPQNVMHESQNVQKPVNVGVLLIQRIRFWCISHDNYSKDPSLII